MPGCLFGTDFLDRPVTGQKSLDILTIESTVGRDLSQRIEIPDLAPLREVCLKEGLGYFILTALLLGEPDEAMGVEGIRRPLDPIEGKDNPIRLTGFGYAFLDRPPGLCAAELCVEIDAPVHAFLRHRRIQLERSPCNMCLLRVPGRLDRLFQSTLPDEAPGTDDIGVNLDLHPVFLHIL
jgi:hypothetical protein